MKSTLPFLFFLIGFCQLSFGQNRKLTDGEINISSAAKMPFVDTLRNCEIIDEWVQHDKQNKTIFLFLQSGIAPVKYIADEAFENKYNIYYFDFGCTTPDKKCITRYNKQAFEYLTITFGNNWKKAVRKDVIGLDKTKQSK